MFTGGISNQDFINALKGKKVVGSGRRGKLFWIELEAALLHPVLHFGMTGSVRVKGEQGLKFVDFDTSGDEWPPKWCKFVLKMDDGTELAFTDPRRLGRIRLVKEPLRDAPICELGPDPIHAMPSVKDLTDIIRRRVKPIKALLLDQSEIAGIGNWIADEVLYQAKIHPSTITQALDDFDINQLHLSIRHVIEFACKVNADSEKFPDTWLFHYRWFKGKKSGCSVAKMPNGDLIRFETVGGRTSAIVPAVQKLKTGKTVGAPVSAKKKEIKREQTIVDQSEQTGEVHPPRKKKRVHITSRDSEKHDDINARPRRSLRLK